MVKNKNRKEKSKTKKSFFFNSKRLDEEIKLGEKRDDKILRWNEKNQSYALIFKTKRVKKDEKGNM